MNGEITLFNVFTKAKDPQELLQILKQYQDKGVTYLASYGFQDISMQELLNIVEDGIKQRLDLEEIGENVNYYIHS